MKKIFQFFIAVVMCLSLSTNIYAINDNEHEITKDGYFIKWRCS